MAGEDTVRYVVQMQVGAGWADMVEVVVPSRTKRAGVIAKAFRVRPMDVPTVGETVEVRVLDEASFVPTRVGSKARDPELVIGVEEERS
jgi:hypothetical protein